MLPASASSKVRNWAEAAIRPTLDQQRPVRDRRGMAKPNESVRSRTRAAILDAASALFRENGFGRTSMDEIARRASVARGTLYYNFVSKDDIAIGIAERHRAAGYADFLGRKAAGANALVLIDEFFGLCQT